MSEKPIRSQMPEVAPERQRKVGQFMIRESLLEKMKTAFYDENMAFPDAAEAAGIPYELVLAQIKHDPELKQMFIEGQGRQSLLRSTDTDLLPETRKPIDIKRELLHKLTIAGVPNMIAEVLPFIRPVKEDGSLDHNHMQYLRWIGGDLYVKNLLPSEQVTKSVKENDDVSKMSDEELALELKRRMEVREELEEKARLAQLARANGGLPNRRDLESRDQS